MIIAQSHDRDCAKGSHDGTLEQDGLKIHVPKFMNLATQS